jgi:hypothetical protein
VAKKVDVRRDAGHPWDERKGFDLMVVDADTEQERDEAVKAAAAKFWQAWIVGFDTETSKPSAVFFKPSGLNAPWSDSPEKPHPGCIDGVEISEEEVVRNKKERRARSES